MSWNKSSNYNNIHGATIKNLLLCYCNNGCTKAPQYYVIITLPLFSFSVLQMTMIA